MVEEEVEEPQVSKRSTLIVVGVIVVLVIVGGFSLGSIYGWGQKPPIVDESLHIGNARFSVEVMNETALSDPNGTNYVTVNATIRLYNYYTDEYLGDAYADGTVYEMENVTMGYVSWVNFSGNTHEFYEHSFLIYANDDEDGFANGVTLDLLGDSGDINGGIVLVDGAPGNMGSITSENFSLSMYLQVNETFSFGHVAWLPPDYREDENCSDVALYFCINAIVDSYTLSIGSVSNCTVFGYDSGKTYIMLVLKDGTFNEVTGYRGYTIDFVAYCQSIPTTITLYNGQWNDVVLSV